MAIILVTFDTRDCLDAVRDTARHFGCTFPDSALTNNRLLFVGNASLTEVQEWFLCEGFNLDETSIRELTKN